MSNGMLANIKAILVNEKHGQSYDMEDVKVGL